MQIRDRVIAADREPFIIGEISGNHLGNLDEALRLIDAAKAAGADAVKTQCYEPQSLTIDCDKGDFVVRNGLWRGRTLFELYKKAHTPFIWHERLYRHAENIGVCIFSSVFDKESIDLLQKLDVPCFKIASFEIVDTNLIKYAAKMGKPLIISTGMASRQEIEEAAHAANYENGQSALLHCVSSYPSALQDANLGRIKQIGDWVGRHTSVGISDHTMGWEIPVAAVALGARIVEKHITMSRDNGSEDAAFSLNPDEFRQMCEAVRAIWKAMQPNEAKSEESSRQLRRSLYVVEDMKAGDVFTEQNVRSIRPGYGLPPKELPAILGWHASQDIQKGAVLTHALIATTPVKYSVG